MYWPPVSFYTVVPSPPVFGIAAFRSGYAPCDNAYRLPLWRTRCCVPKSGDYVLKSMPRSSARVIDLWRSAWNGKGGRPQSASNCLYTHRIYVLSNGWLHAQQTCRNSQSEVKNESSKLCRVCKQKADNGLPHSKYHFSPNKVRNGRAYLPLAWFISQNRL